MAGKKQTTLILNGRRYDALTGEAVQDSEERRAFKPISDIIGPSAPISPLFSTPKPAVSAPQPTVAGPRIMDVIRTTGQNSYRQPQRATTLVRSAVSKPKPGLKGQTKVNAPTTAVATPLTTVAPKWPVTQVNPSRRNRAEQVTQSDVISKFSPNIQASPQAAAAVRTDVVVESIQHQSQDSKDFFERAIEAAESHKQTYTEPKKLARQARKQAKSAAKAARPAHQRLASVVAASVAVLAIGGFIGVQNKTAITLRFANAKAGFSASLPTYQPDGYRVDRFNYSAGTVGTSFHNSAGNHEYTLNQQTTKWDSQALLENYVTRNYSNYQVLQSGEQIIYIYNNNDASWVKDGIWYQLTSNGSLSTSQVLNIATSA